MKLLSWLCSRWHWVCAGLVVVAGVFSLVVIYWDWFATEPCGMESRSTTARNVGILFFGLIAIMFGIWRGFVADRQSRASQDQAETARRVMLNERFQRGAEMLGSPVLAVRLGGIYTLERLAEDEPEVYHVRIVRMLCTFARNPIVTGVFCEDIHEAVRVIGNRSASDIELEARARFATMLTGVNLAVASLSGANLSGVILNGVNLTGASVALANLTGAHLENANLKDTILEDTNLSGANLSGVVNLTQDQLDKACADPAYPPNLDNANDVGSGDPLVWNERPCSFSVGR